MILRVLIVAGLLVVATLHPARGSEDHDPKTQYGQVVFDARNRCEGMLAHVRAELAAAQAKIAALEKAAGPAPK